MAVCTEGAIAVQCLVSFQAAVNDPVPWIFSAFLEHQIFSLILFGGEKEIPKLELPKVSHVLWNLESQFGVEKSGQVI